MATRTPLPAARAPIADASGIATAPFYRFLQELQTMTGGAANGGDVASLAAQVSALAGKVSALNASGGFPTLQVTPPLVSQGLLQNGFARLAWAGTTDDVPEGANLYFTDARVDARIAATVTQHIDGGGASAVFTAAQHIDGGGASG